MGISNQIIATKDQVLALIPQKDPMVMIDNLLEVDETRGVTDLLVRKDNIFCQNEQLLEAGLIENIAQTAAARTGYIFSQKKEKIPTGFIGAIKNLEILFLPNVGDKLRTEIQYQGEVFDIILVHGKITVAGELAAQCELKVFLLKEEN